MKKIVGVLLVLGFVFASCAVELDVAEDFGARALSIQETDKADPIVVEAVRNDSRKNASGAKITSNARFDIFANMGVIFYWDGKQKNDGFLKVEEGVLFGEDSVTEFVLTAKMSNEYWDFVITAEAAAAGTKTPDGCYVFYIPKAAGNGKNINMVFLSGLTLRGHECKDFCDNCGNNVCENDDCDVPGKGCTCCPGCNAPTECDTCCGEHKCIHPKCKYDRCDKFACKCTCCPGEGCDKEVECDTCDDCGELECEWDGCDKDRCKGCNCCKCALGGSGTFIGVNAGTFYKEQNNSTPNWDPYVVLNLADLKAGGIQEVEMINGNNGSNGKFVLGGMVYVKLVGNELIVYLDGTIAGNYRVGLYATENEVPNGNGHIPSFKGNVAKVALNGDNNILHIRAEDSSYYTPFFAPLAFKKL